ncbi:HNH endonuclease, partial [Neisseria gonorrhoeae]
MGLTQEVLKELLRYDDNTGKLYWAERPRKYFNSGLHYKSWNTRFSGKEVFLYKGRLGYLKLKIFKKQYNAHRLIWLFVYGKHASSIGHINRDKTDNRISNLRDVTHAENMKNRGKFKNNTSGHTGVYFHKPSKKWQARIMVNRKNKILGLFEHIEDAVKAREA